jgi:hypothetical protein
MNEKVDSKNDGTHSQLVSSIWGFLRDENLTQFSQTWLEMRWDKVNSVYTASGVIRCCDGNVAALRFQSCKQTLTKYGARVGNDHSFVQRPLRTLNVYVSLRTQSITGLDENILRRRLLSSKHWGLFNFKRATMTLFIVLHIQGIRSLKLWLSLGTKNDARLTRLCFRFQSFPGETLLEQFTARS